VPHGELTAKKWIEKRSNLKEHRDRQTYQHTDKRQKQRQKIIDS